MYNLISTIAERCHVAATKRGKDTSWLGCIQALHTEQREYWEARDNGRDLPDLRVLADEANKLSDEDFTAFYAEKIHNCVTDELADVLITAATWLRTAELEGGENYNPDRDINALLLSGAVQFVCNRIVGPEDVERLQIVVNLKMRYNELRKD